MLPPFVPPSARPASEHLPPITNYLVDRIDRSFETTVEKQVDHTVRSTPTAADVPSPLMEEGETSLMQDAVVGEGDSFLVGGVEYSVTLPSIEGYVARHRYVERLEEARPEAVIADGVQFVQLRHNVSSSATAVNEPSREAEHDTAPNALPTPASQETESVVASAPQEASSAPATPVAPVEVLTTSSSSSSETAAPVSDSSPTPSPTTAKHDWVEAERDSFDWQSVANLAAQTDEEARAAQDWNSTNWETPSASPSEQVAAMLMQLARRVRSGELKIEAVRGMSTEAALASVLTALLSEPENDAERTRNE